MENVQQLLWLLKQAGYSTTMKMEAGNWQVAVRNDEGRIEEATAADRYEALRQLAKQLGIEEQD